MNTYTKQQWIAEQARKHPERVFTSLHHLIDEDWMREAYRHTRKDGATGIDGVTAADYEKDLEANLDDLLGRMKSGRYVAPPVRRHYIPKADGKKRPLGIPTFEDKVAQRAILMLLEPIYETDFLPCSYGFRPGRSAHDALNAVRTGTMKQGQRWVIDADLKAYFDSISHTHLRSFLDLRIKDGVVRRMIDRWLNAGVFEEGTVHRPVIGTPQGGVISPILSNVFLHHVLDEWFENVARPRLRGNCQLVRFADDFVIALEDRHSGKRLLDVLGKRLGRYGLTLHETKTRYVDFRRRRPFGRHWMASATTFDFLGFTHIWAQSRTGIGVVRQLTAKSRFARALKSVHEWCKRNRHLPIKAQHDHLARAIRGHYAYYGLTGNGKRLEWFRFQVARIWRKWLARRSRLRCMNWERMNEILKRYPMPPVRYLRTWQTP
ncbi:MAG: group II intron reverse transcriptase/maturase [Gammaproteobacteria bacterium]|nr:group II intron reverse transcriptase/maturase [Gammaproteobacteria bacterium]MDE0226113.1 group II intron reverse transcriptase/maturase [Gammaproteobacteria bacterium]